jgi:predicted PurR-regulated permease PerM
VLDSLRRYFLGVTIVAVFNGAVAWLGALILGVPLAGTITVGATLDLNPLVVLVVTIAGGGLFGMVGLILAAPITAAAVHITRDLALAREDAQGHATSGEPLPAEP